MPVSTPHIAATRFVPAVAAVLLAFGTACAGRTDEEQAAAQLTGGVPSRGAAAIRTYGCGSCHTISGVPGAQATVGPALDGVRRRGYLAGVVPNTPENLVRWIRDPQGVDSLTAMPNLNVTPQDARDIAAYLYTRK